jgi:hypothetical protein
MTNRRLALTLLGLICAACTRPTVESLAPSAVPDSSWRFHAIAHSRFTVRLPPSYMVRNQFGCYNALATQVLYAPGWRDICIRLLLASEAESLAFDQVTRVTLEARSHTPGCQDCMTYRDVATDTTVLGGRRAIVQRGLATGGIGSEFDAPEIFIRIFVTSDSVAVIAGQVGDGRGAAEVLAIAGTLSLDRGQ